MLNFCVFFFISILEAATPLNIPQQFSEKPSIPNSRTNGWHPIARTGDSIEKIKFIDKTYLSQVIDNNNFSIYKLDDISSKIEGKVKEHQGILWWTENKNSKVPLPHCYYFEGQEENIKSMKLTIPVSFWDCYTIGSFCINPKSKKIAKKASIFPDNLIYSYNEQGNFSAEYRIIEENRFEKFELSRNEDNFQLPGFFWKKVYSSTTNEILIISIAMRATSDSSTECFIRYISSFENNLAHSVLKFGLEQTLRKRRKRSTRYLPIKGQLPIDYIIKILKEKNLD